MDLAFLFLILPPPHFFLSVLLEVGKSKTCMFITRYDSFCCSSLILVLNSCCFLSEFQEVEGERGSSLPNPKKKFFLLATLRFQKFK